MSLPVIVLNWNTWADTFDCVESVSRACPPATEVWLVDNGSQVNLIEEANRRFPRVRTFRWPVNLGFAGGYNRALRIAVAEGHEFAYLLNSDALPEPGFIEPVLAAAEAFHDLAAVGSRLLHGPPPSSVAFDGKHHAPGRVEITSETALRDVDAVSGAAMLVRLSAMERFGYFDERFFCYWEETEWCARVRRNGMRCALAPTSNVVHRNGGSNVGDNTVYYMIRNHYLYVELVAPRGDRRRQRWQVNYKAAVLAEDARRRGDWRGWETLASALDDAQAGRLGERLIRRPTAIARLRLVFLSAWAHIRDKWRVMRGRHRGGAFDRESDV